MFSADCVNSLIKHFDPNPWLRHENLGFPQPNYAASSTGEQLLVTPTMGIGSCSSLRECVDFQGKKSSPERVKFADTNKSFYLLDVTNAIQAGVIA